MKKLLLSLAVVSLAARLHAQDNILLNEVHLNVPGSDENYEFIELKSTTNVVESCAGLTLLIIGNDKFDADDGTKQNVGEILEALDLKDLSTGTNGLLLLGDGYTVSPVGGPWAGSIDPGTAVGDPPGLGNSDIKPNDGLTILLVKGFKGVKGNDVDTDDNGQIDWLQTTPPAGTVPLWSDLRDSIGTTDFDTTPLPPLLGATVLPPYTTANIYTAWASSDLGDRDPDTMARQLNNNTKSTAGSWYGGKLPDTPAGAPDNPTGVVYRANRTFGPSSMIGEKEVTPGRANLAASLPATDFRINEVYLNPGTNADDADRFQCIEIVNTSGQSRSLTDYWLILVDSYDGSGQGTSDPSAAGVGLIIEEWNLSDFATGTNGLLLLGDKFSSAWTPFQDLVDPKTAIADPVAHTNPRSTAWGANDLKGKDGFTLLLVKKYVPAAAPPDLDSNDDGVLNTPLPGGLGTGASIADSIGFSQAKKTAAGKTYATVDLRSVMAIDAAPENLSRKAGNLTVAASAWYGGNYTSGTVAMNPGFEPSAVASPGGTFGATWFGGFRGAGTPGLPNLTAAINPVSPPVAASIRINEVMVDPTNVKDVDAGGEYLELMSTNHSIAYLDGLWVLIVKLQGDIGRIQDGFPLDGYVTGLDGIAIIGDGYNDIGYSYNTEQGMLPPTVSAIDPEVSLGGGDISNDGFGVLLVRNIKSPVITLEAGKPVGDLDPENDGTFLLPSAYTDELVDSILSGPSNPGPAYAWIDSTLRFLPGHVARYSDVTAANSVGAWYYGQVEQTADTRQTEYTSNWAGNFKGAASPGRANHSAPTGSNAVGAVVINEVNFNPAGNDGNFEFVEFADTTGASRSLNGYYLLSVDNVVDNTGQIRHAWSLDGMNTGTNGLLLMGSGYTTGGNPWSAPIMDPATRLGTPIGRASLDSGFGDGVLGRETDNQNIMFLLVREFERYIEFDMDETTGGTTASGGDGVIDVFPWPKGTAGIHDSLLIRNYLNEAGVTPPNPPPAWPWDGWAYTGTADISTAWFPAPVTNFYHVETAARFLGENTPNSAAAWYGGDLTGGASGNSGAALEYVTAADDATHAPRPMLSAAPPTYFTGVVTPGSANKPRNAVTDPDSDGDGVPNVIESAIGSDPNNPAVAGPLPFTSIVNVDGQDYSAFTYQRVKGGSSPTPSTYSTTVHDYFVEGSSDLTTWSSTFTPPMIEVNPPVPNSDGVTEIATVRLPTPTSTAGRQFLRLRVTQK